MYLFLEHFINFSGNQVFGNIWFVFAAIHSRIRLVYEWYGQRYEKVGLWNSLNFYTQRCASCNQIRRWGDRDNRVHTQGLQFVSHELGLTQLFTVCSYFINIKIFVLNVSATVQHLLPQYAFFPLPWAIKQLYIFLNYSWNMWHFFIDFC